MELWYAFRIFGFGPNNMRQEYDIELKDFQKEYLAGIVEKYDLPDMGKAVRCLIDFAIEMESQEMEIFALERCHSCS